MREEVSFGLLLTIAVILAPLSIASIGGATAIYAPLQYEVVDLRQWITGREFLDLFAICRFTPGPSSLLGALIAFKVAGILGALVAMVALYLPSSALCYAVGRIWSTHKGKPWHTAVEKGLTPIAAGLIMAGVLALFQLSGGDLLTGAVMVGVAGVLTWKRKMHPFPLLIGGALAFEIAYLLGYMARTA
jgi:chromate transporter